MDRTFSPGEYRNNIPWFTPQNRQRVLTMLDGWKPLTEKYKCNLAQLVIAWTIDQPGVTFALCGARKTEHSLENARSGSISLEPEDKNIMRKDVENLGAPI